MTSGRFFCWVGTFLLGLQLGLAAVHAQPEIGFIEQFALSDDRRTELADLIPGTEDYFYYHCLHYQNQQQLAEAEAILDQWRTQLGNTPQVGQMWTRQVLLAYEINPARALEFLERQLKLTLDHAPPSRDRAADLPSSLDNSKLELEKLLQSAISLDRGWGQVEDRGLSLILNRQLAPDQLRALIKRLHRPDLPQVVPLIAKELKLRDSSGFGWAHVHQMLTLEQLDELLESKPDLIQVDQFVRAYAARLAPPEGSSLDDKVAMREYLERLVNWGRRLPASQNSFKLFALGNLLRLNLSENRYDRPLFVEYLSIPRAAPYYDLREAKANRRPLADLQYTVPEVPLPPIKADGSLVRRHLEHFFQGDRNVDNFASLLNREYLEKVFAETKILYGIGDAADWYAKLTPSEQKALRDRVEMRFAPHNQQTFKSDDKVSLELEIKNVDNLLVKVYEINTLAYFRSRDQEITTDIDLDGLVANAQRELSFDLPRDRRHLEKLDFPDLAGRGVWVIDLLGAGRRTRALIQKGDLVAAERLGDAGHVFKVFNEDGQPVPSAHLELGGRRYHPQQKANGGQSQIVLPYAEENISRPILLVDGDFATRTTINHQSENYQLQAGFLLDRQSLVAGTEATVAIHTRLTCNGFPISISLLEDATLTINATDADGISSSTTVTQLELDDGSELLHTFLVPQRLARISFVLSGRVFNQSRAEKENVSAKHAVSCNGIAATAQIGDFYLQRLANGYRLLTLGRNGEPISRLPVNVSVKPLHFKNRHSFSLASDEDGSIRLGALKDIESLQVSAEGIQTGNFQLIRFYRSWPSRVYLPSGESLRLALGKATSDLSQFSLYEQRRGLRQKSLIDRIVVESGALTISDLPPGDYVLKDFEASQTTRISVSDAESEEGFAIGQGRILQCTRRAPLSIQEVKLESEDLVVRIDGADSLTRVHVIADVFSANRHHAESMELPDLPLTSKRRRTAKSFYINALRLDEEYGYILNRRASETFPGNMLPQPSLLINPWEISTTQNEEQQAAAGDAIPRSAAAPEPEADTSRDKGNGRRGPQAGWKSFDFLSTGAVALANLPVEDGHTRIPLEDLRGYSSFTVIAVHPTANDSRQITSDEGAFAKRDNRLRTSFDENLRLAQTHRVEILPGGERRSLGDPKTRRVQVYATLADVFQLYGTLLQNPEWDKFRFITRWSLLSEDEKRAHYNQMACHELDFFLFYKDKPFFDAVVEPLLQHKLEKQLVDLWLLGESLAEYDELWRVQRLNTLERILLANSIDSVQPGTKRWLDEMLEANPLPPDDRWRRFEVALRGSALETTSLVSGRGLDGAFGELSMPQAQTVHTGGGMGGFGGAGYGGTMAADAEGLQDGLRSGARKQLGQQATDDFLSLRRQATAESLMFGVDRGRGLAESQRQLFRSLDQTKEWADTNYYRVRLGEQASDLIPPNPFWRQYMSEGGPFFPQDLDLPCSGINEALCALAVIDLPFEADAPILKIEEDQLVIQSESPAIVFLESMEKSRAGQAPVSILAGQDIFLADPSTADETAMIPVQTKPLLRGVPYRARVVVTNPSNQQQWVDVLTQIPAGSIPLSGSKVTRSTALLLTPYSTGQVQYEFYFPSAGQFNHYGAQITQQRDHLTSTDSFGLNVLSEPESVDETTWPYIAGWGTDDQVIDFLAQANLQQLDLSRIAFRMRNRDFYDRVLKILEDAGRYAPTLWAYSVHHNDPPRIAQLLQNAPGFVDQLGSAFSSPLVDVNPYEQFNYEHLDYRPLVVARSHQLGSSRTILNPSLYAQYTRLLNILAHQAEIDDHQRLEICYYMLLQNRVNEALVWFANVSRTDLKTRLQYDFLDAYLEFYRGDYARAKRIASDYADYPVPRWNSLFNQVCQQVDEREALLSGLSTDFISPERNEVSDQVQDPSQQLLTGQRDLRQEQASKRTPALEVEYQAGRLSAQHRNLTKIQVNYYLMDIELLFSRNPFVSQTERISPVIQPNLAETLDVAETEGVKTWELPSDLKNRNLLVEITAEGISRSLIVTANSLRITVVEPYGQLQVLAEQGRAPVEGAYVKVYSRQRDGTVRFFKDGYTDLRGRFDYASLSTGNLEEIDRFSILVLDGVLGASVQEARPPTK